MPASTADALTVTSPIDRDGFRGGNIEVWRSQLTVVPSGPTYDGAKLLTTGSVLHSTAPGSAAQIRTR